MISAIFGKVLLQMRNFITSTVILIVPWHTAGGG